MSTNTSELYKGRGGKRPGAGRPKGTGKKGVHPTKPVRVSTELDAEKYQDLPSLLIIIEYWRNELNEAKARGESLRTYEKLAKFLQEAEELGY